MSFRNVKTIKVLVDFSNSVYRNFYATLQEEMINSDGINVGFILGYCKMLAHAVGEAKKLGGIPELIVCEDRSPTRKRELYTQFQEHLTHCKPDKTWDGESDEKVRYKGNREKEDLEYNPLEICKQFNSCIPCERIWNDGEEADDVLASYIYKNPNSPILLYTTDKDMWQLIPKFPQLKIILSDGSSPTPELCQKNFDTEDFNKVVLHKIIKGDSGDNVKSLNRFQFKKNLDVFEACDGTPEDFLSKLIEKQGEDGKDVQHFLKYLQVARLNYLVVNLRTDLEFESESVDQADKEKWRKLCFAFETPSLLNSPLLDIYIA